MKYCIIYATKTGSAKRCAALLAANLGLDNCDLYDINDGMPDISSYDMVIAGSYVRMGKLNKKIIKLINTCNDKKPFALFMCGMLESGFANILSKNLSEDLIDKSICTDFFGADYKQEQYHGLNKFMIDVLIKAEQSDPSFVVIKKIYTDRIQSFAKEITSYESD